MKICPECETEVENDSKFCPSCGLIFHTTLAPRVQESEPEAESQPEQEAEQHLPAIPSDAEKADTDKEEHSRRKCPECGNRVVSGALSCKFCGLIFYTKPAQPIRAIPRPAIVKHPLNRPILIGLIALVLVWIAYYLPEIRWVFDGNPGSEPRAVKAVPSNLEEFDLAIDVFAQPSGLSWNENEFVLGNNRSGSFVRVSHSRDQNRIRQQRVGAISPLTWNGKQFVGYRESGLLRPFKKYQFTAHDATTLNVIREHSVSEPIGGLAWDGAGYWAAIRNEEKDARGYLYRLDQNLEFVNKMVSPSGNCRGLAWDGSNLWFLDDVERKIHVLDVKGVSVRVVESLDIPIRSPAGIAFDGQTIWIADSGEGRLLRLKPTLPAVWKSRDVISVREASAQPVNRNYDIYKGSQTLSNKGVEVFSFSANLASNILYASWDIYFGHGLFDSRGKRLTPAFAKFTITVDGGNLSAPVAKIYNAHAGRSTGDQELISSSLGPGTYYVGLFIYLQYTDEKGTGRVLSKSIPPLKIVN